MELFIGEDAESMRSGQDAEWAVVRSGIIEVEAEGEHLFEGG